MYCEGVFEKSLEMYPSTSGALLRTNKSVHHGLTSQKRVARCGAQNRWFPPILELKASDLFSSTSMFYLEAPNLCFGHRFYKRHHLPRLVFERALWREKRARMVAKTCALYCKFAARGVQSTLDPLGIVHANLISVKLGTAIAHLQTQPTTTAIV